jgi:hypothetical protein
MVFGFVKRSGGHAKIYSKSGEGTTVRLYLPRTAGLEPARPPGDEAPVELPHGAASRARDSKIVDLATRDRGRGG